MDALIGAVGAIVGGALGAILGPKISYSLDKAKLKMSLYDIQLSPWQPQDKAAIADEIIQHKQGSGFLITPNSTIEILGRHNQAEVPDKTYQHPLLYTMYLYRANRDNENARIKNEVMPMVVRELKSLMRQGLSDEFIDLYIAHQMTFLSYIAGEAKRNNEGIVSIVKGSASEVEDLFNDDGMIRPIVVDDENGDYYINCGRHNIGLIWSNAGVHKNVVKNVCATLAYALASWDIDVLEKLISFFESISWSSSVFSETESHIKSMLMEYSRVIVQGVLSNTGRTPISVLGGTNLKIASSGYVLNGGEGPLVDHDIDVNMQLIAEDRISQLPCLTVNGGESLPFTAASKNFVYTMEDKELIKGVYRSERMALLSFEDVAGEVRVEDSIPFMPNKSLQGTP